MLDVILISSFGHVRLSYQNHSLEAQDNTRITIEYLRSLYVTAPNFVEKSHSIMNLEPVFQFSGGSIPLQSIGNSKNQSTLLNKPLDPNFSFFNKYIWQLLKYTDDIWYMSILWKKCQEF